MTTAKAKPYFRKQKPTFATESERASLPARKSPYWTRVKKYQRLGYRKGARGAVWVAQITNGQEEVIGVPPEEPKQDDYPVYTYAEAMLAAETWCEQKLHPKGPVTTPDPTTDPWKPGTKQRPENPTVGHALEQHLWILEQKQIESFGSARSKIRRVQRALGHIELSKLTENDIEVWRGSILNTGPQRRSKKGEEPKFDEDFEGDDPISKRRRQSTANRYLADLLAALNRAYRAGWVESDLAWRGIERYPDATASRDEVLDARQQSDLLNRCSPELRGLTYAALVTGNRPGALRRLKVKHFRPLDRAIVVGYDKTHMRERLAPLRREAIAVFDYICDDRDGEAYMFVKANGEPWGKNHYSRAFKQCMKEMDLDLTFYALRHTCITTWLLSGVKISVVASAVGTSEDMIEKHYKNPRVGQIADELDEKAQSIGSFDEEVEAVHAKYEALRKKRLLGKLDLKFDLNDLRPSKYVGKIEGGATDAPPPKVRPTPAELEALINQFPACKIGDMYGVSGNTVKQWCLKHGIEPSHRGDWAKRRKELRVQGEDGSVEVVSRPSTLTREVLAELIPQLPATEIGKQFGLSANAILNWADKWGIPKPEVGHWAKKQGEEHQEAKKARREVYLQKKPSGQ